MKTIYSDFHLTYQILDSDIDSDLSEEEEQHEDPKSFPRYGKENMNLAVYENCRIRDRNRPLIKLIKDRSGYKEIEIKVYPEDNPDLPKLFIEINPK